MIESYLAQMVFWIGTVSQVSDVAHGPLVKLQVHQVKYVGAHGKVLSLGILM